MLRCSGMQRPGLGVSSGMIGGAEKRPAWAEHSLYEEAVAHFEAEEWEEATSLFSQLAGEFPDDQQLQRIVADLRLKASLSRGQGRRGRKWTRKPGRSVLLGLGVVALIALLVGLSYAIYTRWLLPATTSRDQLTYQRHLHQLARGYMGAGDYTKAVDLYGQILRQVPDDAVAAAGLERAEELQGLAVAYDRALELTREERWNEALWAWRMIRARDPNFKDVDYWITFVKRQDVLSWLFEEAEMRYGIGDWNGVLEVLERLRSESANYRRDEVEALLVGSLVNLAEQKLWEAADPADVYDQVMELFDRALEVRPHDESLLAERAVARAYSQSFARLQDGCEEALQELRMAYRLVDVSPVQRFIVLYEANMHCGDERMQAGDFQAARSCYEAAMDLPVDDVSEASTKHAALVPMLTPTATPKPPSATPTRLPATPTPRPPTATATPSYRYSLLFREYLPNCGLTFVEGTVWNADGVTQTGGARVKVWTEGWEVTRVTPTDPAKGAGYYDAIFSVQEPREGNWFVVVVDGNGNPLSEVVPFDTNTVDCEPDGTGRQWVIIDFKATY